jgi:dihydropyrimidine dehydrogenase (NAD+) subunit PreA
MACEEFNMVRIGELEITGPVLVASGPPARKVKFLKEAEANLAGAATLKLTFKELPFPSQLRTFSIPGVVMINPTDRRLVMDEAVELLREAKKEIKMPLFANLGALGSDIKTWLELSETFEAEGADGLELNFCCPNLDVSFLEEGDYQKEYGGTQIGQNPQQCHIITRKVKEVVRIPVVPKFLPNALDVKAVARASAEGGADGIHIVGMPVSGLPPVDVKSGRPEMALVEGVSFGASDGPIAKYSTYQTIARVRQAVGIPIIASGGIVNWRDAVSAIMWGASLVAVCSAVMWWGFEVVKEITEGIKDFMREEGYADWLEFSGKALKYLTTPDKMRFCKGAARVDEELCIGCGECLKPGHCDAITMREDKARVDEEKCVACGICPGLCPVGAIRLLPEG